MENISPMAVQLLIIEIIDCWSVWVQRNLKLLRTHFEPIVTLDHKTFFWIWDLYKK